MAEMTSASPSGLSRQQEEAAFYHESALNSAWTGSRLMIGITTSGLGAFIFAFFYLRSVNSHGNFVPPHFVGPKPWQGAVIMGLVVLSAIVQSLGLTQIKAGRKSPWLMAAGVALVLGLAAVGFQIWQLTVLPFQPGDGGLASCFTGAMPVFAVLLLGTMVWLEILVAASRRIPYLSFVEQPPTFAEAAEVQRFQASLSSFTLYWNFLAVAAIVLWLLFYVVK